MCLDEMGSNSRTSVCSQATVSTDLQTHTHRSNRKHQEHAGKVCLPTITGGIRINPFTKVGMVTAIGQ